MATVSVKGLTLYLGSACIWSCRVGQTDGRTRTNV